MGHKLSNSIRRKSKMILGVMLAFEIGIFSLFIFCYNRYTSSMEFYTGAYYHTASFSAQLNSFETAIMGYYENEQVTTYEDVKNEYDLLEKSFSNVYNIRFLYGDEIKQNIIEIHDYMDQISAYIINMDTIIGMEYNTNNSEYIDRVISIYNQLEQKLLETFSELIEIGNGNFEELQNYIFIFRICLVFVSLGFLLLALYLILFIRNRVVEPISKVSEWANLFDQGYSDMTGLVNENDDEIGALIESFNIVQSQYKHAISLKKEYEALNLKLIEEEEHKKKFIQQLYVEKREKETISSEAKRDGLTGLYNRRSFDNIVEEFIVHKLGGNEAALFIIDMDHFKNVNDTLGHLAGDFALKILAGTMRIVFPEGYLGRYGGDEFVVFLNRFNSMEQLESLAEDLREKMDREIEYDHKKIRVTVSIGIATSKGVSEYSELYMYADKALYYSKEHGRNQYNSYTKIENKIAGELKDEK